MLVRESYLIAGNKSAELQVIGLLNSLGAQ